MTQAVVLLSAGLDSTVNLFKAHLERGVAVALTVDYGQRAAGKEIQRAKALCDLLAIEHQIIDLSWFRDLVGQSSLLDSGKSVPQGDEVEIDSLETSERTAESVWVPNRNGVLLNLAAAVAESRGLSVVIPGFNKEEGQTFPDNTPEYMSALDKSFSYSTANQVKVECYTKDLTKPEIVKLGKSMDVPFDLVWPCYFNGEQMCRQCESCQRFLRAMESS